MASIALIGVVRLFQDGAALAEIVDGDPTRFESKPSLL